MSELIDEDLYRRAKALLEPGEIQLNGLVLHTDFDQTEESLMHRTTVEVGDTIAAHAETGDTYVFSGTDDPDYGLNQHQGLTLADDDFVWECQQLLRDGTYDVVFYYEASADHEAILDDLRDAGHEVTGVEG
jgi:hypothetical protein